MSERTEHPVGVPGWVDILQPDPEQATAFYTQLFGWEAEDRSAAGSARRYYLCRLRGRDVAGVGSSPEATVSPTWNTYVRVDSVDAVTGTALDAGGSIVLAPYGSVDGGRRAILTDPAGATFGVWQPGSRPGAQLVNEPSAWAMSMLNTAAIEEATHFYGALFGWTTSTFDAGGFEVTMWHLPGYVGGEPSQPVPRDVVAAMAPLTDAAAAAHWDVNFWVHDADEVAAKATALGGSVVAAPSNRPPFREAVVADPAGAAVAVSQLLTGA